MPRSKLKKPKFPNLCRIDSKNISDEYIKEVNVMKQIINNYGNALMTRLEAQQTSFLARFSEAELQKTVGQLRSENTLIAALLSCSEISATSQKDDDPLERTDRSVSWESARSYITEASVSGGRPQPPAPPAPSFPAPSAAKKRPSRRLSRSHSSSRAYTPSSSSSVSSGVMPPPSSSYRSGAGRRGRSSSASAVGRQPYQTPSSKQMKNFPPITPKVTPHTPMSVLRRPRQGEMVMSLSGSPLLLGSASGVDEMANCNIPLRDGTVISLVPYALRKSQVTPAMNYMGQDTYDQLATLRRNLDIVCQMGAQRNS